MAEPRRPRPTPDDEATIIARPGRAPGLAPGVVLGNTYRIDAVVARGSTGAIYRATHIELGTTHAIKVLLPALADDPDMVRRLVEEGRKLARLRHEAIVEYEGLFRDAQGLRYLVMEFIEGPSLATILKVRRLEPNEVLRLRDRLAEGLAAAHEKGIIHRDICPDNIILPHGEIGHAKLIDFGMAKAWDAEATVVGSGFAAKFAYASPEQLGLFGGQVDLRSDIYSLGLVLATAAIGFGKTLDMGNSLASVLAKREAPPDLTPIPAELRPAIAPMLMPRPEERAPSMRALLPGAAPAASLGAAAPAAREAASPPPGRNAWRAAAVATVALAAAVALVFIFRSTLWPPSLATLKTDLAAAATGYECASITTQAEADRSVNVSGHVASAADLDRLRRAVGSVYGVGRISFGVRELGWPYCQVVDLLQPYTKEAPPDAPTVTLATGAAYTGERLSLAITMPKFDGYLLVDYFVKQGQVLHLLPNGPDRLNIKPARNHFVLGRPPSSLMCWTFPDNPGEQLITVIASTRPLFAAPLPAVENADAYLKSLAAGLVKARQIGAATLSFQLQPPPFPNPAALCPGA